MIKYQIADMAQLRPIYFSHYSHAHQAFSGSHLILPVCISIKISIYRFDALLAFAVPALSSSFDKHILDEGVGLLVVKITTRIKNHVYLPCLSALQADNIPAEGVLPLPAMQGFSAANLGQPAGKDLSYTHRA